MNIIGAAHQKFVFSRRTAVLADQISRVIPSGSRQVLDVGCGDGTIDALIGSKVDGLEISGVDVLVRPGAHIQVQHFDGIVLPFPNDSFDVVMFVDVLHHTDDPSILLHEAKRVARRAVVIKDHINNCSLDRITLRFMDYVGNAHHGVVLPYNYWSSEQWNTAFKAIGLKTVLWNDRVGLYPFPASLAFERKLHFIAQLRV